MASDYEADGKFVESLKFVLDQDLNSLCRARKNYGESWCKRGGVGAFMMLARKWDRLENFLNTHHAPSFQKYDILTAAAADQRAEGVIDDIRDLRRYLALVEAKLVETNVIHPEVRKEAPHDIAIAPRPLDQVKHETEPFMTGTGPALTVGHDAPIQWSIVENDNGRSHPLLTIHRQPRAITFAFKGLFHVRFNAEGAPVDERGAAMSDFTLIQRIKLWAQRVMSAVYEDKDDTPKANVLHPG